MISLRQIVNCFIQRERGKNYPSSDKDAIAAKAAYEEALRTLQVDLIYDKVLEDLEQTYNKDLKFYEDKIEYLENRLKSIIEYKEQL